MTEYALMVEIENEIQAPMQRPRPSRPDRAIEVADLRVDPLARTVARRGEKIPLSPTEFDLLVYLARNPGRVISREELLRNVWGHDYLGHRHTVLVEIGWLRIKLSDRGWLIQSVPGVGYRLAILHGAPS